MVFVLEKVNWKAVIVNSSYVKVGTAFIAPVNALHAANESSYTRKPTQRVSRN